MDNKIVNKDRHNTMKRVVGVHEFPTEIGFFICILPGISCGCPKNFVSLHSVDQSQGRTLQCCVEVHSCFWTISEFATRFKAWGLKEPIDGKSKSQWETYNSGAINKFKHSQKSIFP